MSNEKGTKQRETEEYLSQIKLKEIFQVRGVTRYNTC